MPILEIPPGIWAVLSTQPMLVGLACLALGIPGKNRLKMNLFWAAMAWSTLPLFISAIYTYEYNEMPVPDILSMGMNLFFLLAVFVPQSLKAI